MNIRPKVFYAARDFSHAGASYRVGDVVPEGRTLADVLAFDQGFVTTTKPTAKPTADQATDTEADPAATPEEE